MTLPPASGKHRRGRVLQIAALGVLGLATTLLTAILHGADSPEVNATADRLLPSAAAGPVLLVDDDQNDPDVRPRYVGALDELGVEYRVWDTGPGDLEPDLTDLAPFRSVIWFTGGAAAGPTGPGPSAELALAAWLERGGRLLLSSQDYNWARGGPDGFPTDRLGVGRVADVLDTHRMAVGESPLLAGWGPWPLVFRFDDSTDVLEPAGNATTIVRSDTGASIGISATAGESLAVYLAFALEAVSPAAGATALLGRFLTWESDRGGSTVFEDGFETGDASRWSAVQPPPPCQITVTQPGDGDVWQMGTTRDISWTTYGGCDPQLRIVLRRSGGVVLTIDGSTPNDGVYPWTIPTDLTPADDYRIRVREVGGAQGNSVGEFTIVFAGPTPTSTIPPTPSATPTIGPTQPPEIMPFRD